MIDVDALSAALRGRLPGFDRLEACERLSAGASLETYKLDAIVEDAPRRMALRRSQGGSLAMAESSGLAVEAKLLAAAAFADVPVPRLLALLEPTDGVGWAVLTEWLDGETLGPRIARSPRFETARKTLARQCGETLARLHAIDLDRSGLRTHLRVLTPEAAVRETYSSYRSLDCPQPVIDFTARWLCENLPPPRPLALVHGDFRNGNLMVSPELGLVGVLDWELAHIGDPMRDLGWLCTRSWRFGAPSPVGGFGAHKDLFAGYQAVTGRPVDADAVAFWEVFGSFWWSVTCLSMARAAETGNAGPGPERPMIGRRSSEGQIDCLNVLIPGPAQPPASVALALSTADLPTAQGLLEGVLHFLREEAPTSLTGRASFLARVAGNAVDVVLREMAMGGSAMDGERASFADRLGMGEGGLDVLRERLCDDIREGRRSLDDKSLHRHLRDAALAQVLIDQPDYPGAREALAHCES